MIVKSSVLMIWIKWENRITQLDNAVEFGKVNLSDVLDLLMSDEQWLYNVDLIELEKESREEAGEEGTEEDEVVHMRTGERL